MKKINIAELLKDCPKGMELDCTMYDNVTFERFDVEQNRCYFKAGPDDTFWTTCHGKINGSPFGKCVIFPKGKTTWEGFVPPCKFKEGDVIYVEGLREWVAIVNSCNDNAIYDHVALENKTILHFSDNLPLIRFSDKPVKIRLAIEEEKNKLFDAIKEQGYKWNPETKTLEKLTEFKDGDVAISDLGDIHLLRTKDSSYCAYRIRWTGLSKLDNTITTGVKVARLATEEEKHILFDSIKANGYRWNEETKSLEKLINKNKFVIGAIVTNGKIKGRICLRDGDSYVLEDGTHIFFNEVHNWELVSNKFNISTLKPFDKVLVRHNLDNKWCSSFFSHIDSDFHSNCYKYVTVAGKSYPMCIPYEGNEHLSGATNNCIEYYKTW